MVNSSNTSDTGVSSVGQSDDQVNDESPYVDRSIVWAGGGEARELAAVLSNDRAVRAGANIASSCIDAKADLLVLSNRSSFDLCSVVVSQGFDRDATRSIVAAVGGGPHSNFAATLTDWLSRSLGVPGRAVYGYSEPSDRPNGEAVLGTIAEQLPQLDVDTVEVSSPASMVEMLDEGTLLVVGAPGGSWFQRRFFGPGARIQAKAPGGTIVVTENAERVYRVMRRPLAFGPSMKVRDALQLSEGFDAAVAENGNFLGTVEAAKLRRAPVDLELHQVMDSEMFLSADDEITEAIGLLATHGTACIPVVDSSTRLVGCVSARDLAQRAESGTDTPKETA